jgi:hypothetical protein
VRQHGKEAREGLLPTVGATHHASGERFTVHAVEDSPAHYSASLLFPMEGTWEWWIDGFGYEQPMPDLTVLPASSTVPRAGAGGIPSLIGAVMGAAGLVGGLAVRTRRPRWGMALVVLSLAMIAAALIAPSRSTPGAVASMQARDNLVARGEALFVAKGCITCHLNSRAEAATQFSVDIGPNLSRYHNSPDYLRAWLSDPAVLKLETRMPDLDLSDDEIEGLIAFVNAGE